jgi:GTP pyrophosphokinase
VKNIADSERLIEIEWGATRQAYPVDIHIEAFDRAGLLRDIATIVADEGISMSAATSSSHADNTATVVATLLINNIQQLHNVLARLEGLRDILEIRREKA